MQVRIKDETSWVTSVRGDCSLTTTHFAFAVLIGMLLNLNRDEWFAALTFGVVIDADHLFAVPRYVSDNGAAAILNPTWDDGSGLPWKSSFHHPEGAFVVGYLAFGWRLFIPFLFWGMHVAIDEFQLSTIEYSGVIESVFFSSAVGAIVALGYKRWLEVEPDGDFRHYLTYVRTMLKNLLSRRSVAQPPVGGTI